MEYRYLTLQVQGRERGDDILNISYFIPPPYPQAQIFVKIGAHQLLKGGKVNKEEVSLWFPIWVALGSNNSDRFEIVITQLVGHLTENQGVTSSILVLGT